MTWWKWSLVILLPGGTLLLAWWLWQQRKPVDQADQVEPRAEPVPVTVKAPAPPTLDAAARN